MYFISDLLIPSSNRIKRCFLQGIKDEYTFSAHDWPGVLTNKDSIFAWNNAMLEIGNSDGTLRQSIRSSSELSFHRKTNAKVNDDHTVTCVKVSKTEIICYAVDKSRDSHRHKRCPIGHNFIPSDKTNIDSSLSDCVW